MIGELQLRLLGGLRLDRDGAPLTGFISNKAPALLAYLAVTRRAHSRDALATLFWGDLPDADAKNNLRQALTNLRRFVEANLIITRDTIEFNAETPYFLDVSAFERLLKHPIGLPPDQVLHRLQAAVELYRGEFLEGVFVRDAPEFEEWALAQRTHWRDLALHAFHTLTDMSLARGEYAPVIDYAARLLALDPWREEAHRQLMLAHVRSGQPSAALAQYEVCRRVMQQEFNAEPSAATTTLYERIRAALISPGSNLSRHLPPANLIGRERELDEIQQRLRDPACRLLTLTGLGGSGKTRLALDAAQRLARSFLNGAYFVPLATVNSLDALGAACAEALSYVLPAGQAAPAVLNYLRPKELLLVLDNFEHLIDRDECVRFIADIVKHAPEVKVIVTSRERLNLQHEWLYDVNGLSPAEALALFTQGAQRVAAAITADDAAAIARVCRSVHGLPLGIELAAAWTRAMSCAEIAAELERSATQLASPLRDAPERHRSLQAVFDHSWQLLSPAEQRALAAMSIFRGGFTREAAQAVAGTSASMLLGLVNQSLVQRSQAGRFDLHDLVRQFAAEKVTEIAALRDRHGAYYADFLAARRSALRSTRQATVITEIKAEIDNARLMWRYALERSDADIFARALIGFFWIFDSQGRSAEAAELLSAAAACVAQDPARVALHGQLLARQVTFLTLLSDFERAEAACRQTVALSQTVDDIASQAFVTRYLGYFAMVRGDLPGAQALMTRCLDLYRTLDDGLGLCDALISLALVLNNLGQYEAARQHLLEAVERAAAVNDEIGQSVALSNLGSTAYYAGQFKVARGYFQASYDLDAAHGDRRRMAVNLHNLACVACDLREWSTALQIQQDALARFAEVAQQEGLMHCRQNLARIQLGLNDLAEARRHLAEALQIAQHIGAVRDSLEISVIGAELLRREGRPDRAAHVIGRVLQHSAATAAVKADARTVLTRLEAEVADSAQTPAPLSDVSEIAALILNG
ncbi:MAG: tetratricopeptide repeat protein [Thermoflexales bacterium]|nr:tetratricopeptide repeat protein [Thermoflexales bacterium]